MKIEINRKKNYETLCDVPFGDLFISNSDKEELYIKIHMQDSYCGIASVRSGCVVPMSDAEAKAILVKRVNRIIVEAEE